MATRNVTKSLIKDESVLARMAEVKLRIMRDTYWREYRVEVAAEKGLPRWDYHTDNKRDAVCVATFWVGERMLYLAQLAAGEEAGA